MSKRIRNLNGIPFLITIVIIVWLSSSAILNEAKKELSNNVQLTLLCLENVWGAKVESNDGLCRFFAGIQTGAMRFGEDKSDYLSSPKMLPAINDTQFTYIIELGRFDILLKILSYQPPREDVPEPPTETEELKYLNYIVENSGCKKCSKNRMILLEQNDSSLDQIQNIGDVNSFSNIRIFGLLIHVLPK